MIGDINKVIEGFEKLGYSHEEAVNIVEPATTLSDEEFKEIKRIADEFSRMTADEIEKIIEETEM